MDIRRCRYCGELAYRVPIAHGDEWIDSKGNRWLFHICSASRASDLARIRLKSDSIGPNYMTSPARLAAVQKRIKEQNERAQRRARAIERRYYRELRKSYCERSREQQRRKLLRQRRRRAYKKNLTVFQAVDREVGPIDLGKFLRENNIRMHTRSTVFIRRLRQHVQKKINADERLMQKFDKFVEFHLNNGSRSL